MPIDLLIRYALEAGIVAVIAQRSLFYWVCRKRALLEIKAEIDADHGPHPAYSEMAETICAFRRWLYGITAVILIYIFIS